MTGPGNVLEWRDIGNWRQRILDLMSDVITHSVMENIRAEPPEYCHWEDPDWLQNALAKAGLHTEAPPVEILAARLPRAYSYVRAYHACRPTNIEGYYRSGLLAAKPKLLNDLATEYFLKPPRITQETLNRAVEVVEKQNRRGHIYFVLDDRILTGSHYLKYGSEYLSVIAAELKRMTGENCPAFLKTIGIPTIFVCDLPISYVAPSVHNFSGKLVECLFEEYVRPQGEVPSIDFTFTISVELPPSVIVSHYHPEMSPTKGSGRTASEPDSR